MWATSVIFNNLCRVNNHKLGLVTLVEILAAHVFLSNYFGKKVCSFHFLAFISKIRNYLAPIFFTTNQNWIKSVNFSSIRVLSRIKYIHMSNNHG
jgi:hypothetical protein